MASTKTIVIREQKKMAILGMFLISSVKNIISWKERATRSRSNNLKKLVRPIKKMHARVVVKNTLKYYSKPLSLSSLSSCRVNNVVMSAVR